MTNWGSCCMTNRGGGNLRTPVRLSQNGTSTPLSLYASWRTRTQNQNAKPCDLAIDENPFGRYKQHPETDRPVEAKLAGLKPKLRI